MDLHLSSSDFLELKKIQRNVVGTPSYVKVTCVLMFAQRLSVQVISNSLGIDASTAYRYLNTYTSSGIDPLLGSGHKGYWRMLDSHQLSALREELKAHVYTDAKSVSKWVESALGVVYTAQGMVDLLNRIGLPIRKPRKSLVRRMLTSNSNLLKNFQSYSSRRTLLPWFIMPMVYIQLIIAVLLMLGLRREANWSSPQ